MARAVLRTNKTQARYALIEMQGHYGGQTCPRVFHGADYAGVSLASPKQSVGFLCAQTDEEEPLQLHLAITEWNDTGLRGVIDNPHDRIAPVKASLGIWL